MFYKFLIIISAIYLNTLISACCKTAYIIGNKSLTYTQDSKRYLNIQKIDKIKEGQKTFIFKADLPIYIKKSEELMLKKGWNLIGNSGNEEMIKEKSDFTSAIKIRDADDIKIKNFHLKMDEYAIALEKSLIEIDNEKTSNKMIEIVNMKLSNHYCGIWIKRGKNIRVDSCMIFENGHQINLGLLPRDTSQICKYKVCEVNISNSQIRDSKGGNVNGIKTLSNCTGIKIMNNLIAKNKQDGIDLYPGGLDVVIQNNTIRDNGVHGIEVKMYKKYLPHQTGQIRNVQINDNNIIKNKYNGITCLDTMGTDYYAKGISISGNRIDSNGRYGIFSKLPVLIKNNILYNNGLQANRNNSQQIIGYPGIFLLNGRPKDPSFIINNEIIEQAPNDTIILAFWMVVTEAKSNTTISDNKIVISDSSTFKFKKYGVGLIHSSGFTSGKYVEKYNEFYGSFKTKVVVDK